MCEKCCNPNSKFFKCTDKTITNAKTNCASEKKSSQMCGTGVVGCFVTAISGGTATGIAAGGAAAGTCAPVALPITATLAFGVPACITVGKLFHLCCSSPEPTRHIEVPPPNILVSPSMER